MTERSEIFRSRTLPPASVLVTPGTPAAAAAAVAAGSSANAASGAGEAGTAACAEDVWRPGLFVMQRGARVLTLPVTIKSSSLLSQPSSCSNLPSFVIRLCPEKVELKHTFVTAVYGRESP